MKMWVFMLDRFLFLNRVLLVTRASLDLCRLLRLAKDVVKCTIHHDGFHDHHDGAGGWVVPDVAFGATLAQRSTGSP